MLKSTMTLFVLLFQLQAWGALDRNVAEYNRNHDFGLRGHDPVSYFPEGGERPARGVIIQSYKGMSYKFVSTENKITFLGNADKYEPTYGGWCAWAMANGSKADIDPTQFTFSGSRLHFFASPRAKRNFDRDVAKYEVMADQNWKRFSGEEPRL